MTRTGRVGATAAVLMALVGMPEVALGQWSVGVRGGYASFDVRSDPAPNGNSLDDTSARSGFAGGVVLGYRFSSLFSLSTEGSYTPKGFEVTDDEEAGSLQLDVIEVPLFANLHLGAEGAPVSPRVFGGPWVSFEVGCDLKLGTVQVPCDDVPGGTPRQTTDYGLAVGGAVDVDAGPVVVTVDGRYHAGLRNLDDQEEQANLNLKTGGFTVGLGLSVPFGR